MSWSCEHRGWGEGVCVCRHLHPETQLSRGTAGMAVWDNYQPLVRLGKSVGPATRRARFRSAV